MGLNVKLKSEAGASQINAEIGGGIDIGLSKSDGGVQSELGVIEGLEDELVTCGAGNVLKKAQWSSGGNGDNEGVDARDRFLYLGGDGNSGWVEDSGLYIR